MKISLLQTDVTWRDAQENIRRAESFMASQPGADLYVLPEMWCTGFDVSPDEHTLEQSKMGYEWMLRKAEKLNACIAGSLVWQTEASLRSGRFVNTLFVMGPDGSVCHYAKRHLFGYGGEDAHYLSGCQRVVMQVGDVRVLPQICYDLRFPVASRNTAENPYDLIIYVASWPASRQTAWDVLLRARAIENQCYVAGVNRFGDDLHCHYEGGTTLIDPYGNNLFSLRGSAACASAEIDLQKMRQFREKFPVLKDADVFQ